MWPSQYSSKGIKAALAVSVALHAVAFTYNGHVSVAQVEAPQGKLFEVALRQADKPALPSPQPVQEPAPATPEPAPVPEPPAEPDPQPIPIAEAEPIPEPEPEPVRQAEPAPQVKSTPVPSPTLESSASESGANSEVPEPVDEKPMQLAGTSLEPMIHEVDVLPRQLSAPQPRYPAAELRRGVEGAVRVRLLIDESGRVEDVEFLAGAPSFCKAIESVIDRWRFEPARVDGRPVKVWGTKTVQFALNKG